MKYRSRLPAVLIAGFFLALHLPFLPASLEDLDSINFALGIRDFDVARHQPHPPGYPLFIVAAKAVHALGISEVHALSLVSVVAGALAILAFFGLFRVLDRDRPPGPHAWMAVLVVATCPLYWLTAARPLSDVAGLAAAIAVQVLILGASGPAGLVVAALCAGLAAGIRSQVVWLTVPLLTLGLMRVPGARRLRTWAGVACGYATGVLVWLIPLVVVSGGLDEYTRAFVNQGAEDLSGVTMLATNPTIRQLARALQYAFIAPWAYWQAGAVVVVLAALGLMQMLRRARAGLWTLLAGFGPYLVFDLLFQETITTRYALPLVVPLGYLVVRGVTLLPGRVAIGAALAVAGFSGAVADSALYRYSRMEAPAFRMLGDMNVAGADRPVAPVLALHRREEFDMRRPIQWVGDRMPQVAERLPAPPKHEWLELVKYWNRGGRNPVWFIADPLRSDLALVGYRRRPTLYRWPFTQTILLGGARPNEMDWHTIEEPAWYLGEGWAITPETAGIAREDGRGPGFAPIEGWVRRASGPVTLLVGGRNLGTAGPVRVRLAADGKTLDELTVAPGFFLRMFTVPTLAGAGDYAPITIESDSRELAVEQFDAQPAGRVVFGFGEGWHEQEYNPSTGVLWRWTTDRATIRVRAEGHALALTLSGEVEAAPTSHVVIRAGDRVAAEFDSGQTFTRTVLIPAAWLSSPESTITIESSASYVPAETRWRSKDFRRLGLKIVECQITPVS